MCLRPLTSLDENKIQDSTSGTLWSGNRPSTPDPHLFLHSLWLGTWLDSIPEALVIVAQSNSDQLEGCFIRVYCKLGWQIVQNLSGNLQLTLKKFKTSRPILMILVASFCASHLSLLEFTLRLLPCTSYQHITTHYLFNALNRQLYLYLQCLKTIS